MTDMTQEPERKVCAVCARVLNPVVLPDGEKEWHHGLETDMDHLPVPVDPEEVYTVNRCDFCNEDNPPYVLPSRSFRQMSYLLLDTETGNSGTLDHGSGENWMACEGCAPLIETNQWNALLRRVTQSWETRHGESMSEESQKDLRATYRLLRKNITGPLRRWTPEKE